MLASVDGTGSSSWMKIRPDTGRWNSNVRNFNDDCLEEPRKYFAGPDTLGLGVSGIAADVWDFLMANLRKNPNASVNLVGHSRGGHIVVAVAGYLDLFGWMKYVPDKEALPFDELYDIMGGSPLQSSGEPMADGIRRAMESFKLGRLRKNHNIKDSQNSQPVNFLGLYDAVDRSLDFFTAKISGNVRLVYHAVRNPADHSRTWFGNTARRFDESAGRVRSATDPKVYNEKLIMGSHGAIGGDPGGGDIAYTRHIDELGAVGAMRPADLQACTTPVVVSDGPLITPDAPFVSPIRTYRYQCDVVDAKVKATELAASRDADQFIRDGARAAGLKFK